MINDGRRLELFFAPNGMAHQYIKNISIIGEKDDNVAKQYKEWLLQVEEPKIRDRILDAIENDFLEGIIDGQGYKCRLELHKELFDMYETMIQNEVPEREFLRSYA